MDVELLIRWMKPKTKERIAKEKKQSYYEELGIPSEQEDEVEKYEDVFAYAPMTFPIEEVARSMYVDKEHTALVFKDGLKYIAKVPYDNFQLFRCTLLGTQIRYLDDIKTVRISAASYNSNDY